MKTTCWPKTFPPLTTEQEEIRNDFVHYWHEVLPKQFGIIERFNHTYPLRDRPEGTPRTLEIGAGIGEHLEYEKLTVAQQRVYHALELRERMCVEIRRRFPNVKATTGDCQEHLPFANGYFERILAVHVLEHLPNLPSAVKELHRVCDKEKGVLSIVIPCEGSMAYTLARRISAQRVFENRYGQPYKWFIEREHVNQPREIVGELKKFFTVSHRRFFPFRIPMYFCNLVIGLTLRPRKESK